MTAADAIGAEIYASTASTGMVMVIVRDGEVYLQGYGQTAPGSLQRPGAHSLIRLCSLSKILTADLLYKLVADRTVQFTDPLQTYAPTGATVPTLTFHGPAIRAITLGDLATHTSGLPREQLPSPRGAAAFTFPNHRQRWAWLPTQKLRTSPGTAAQYSNVAFDLLSDAVESATGQPYPQLFQQRTATPLGLTETTLTPTPEQCARLMVPAQRASDCADTRASAGSSGMYSTAADMTLWLKYLLGLPGVPVHQNAAALASYVDPAQLTSVKGMDHAGDPTGLGLGWVRLGQPGDASMIIEKTGGGGGFSTYIALDPTRHSGVFLAATDGSVFTHTHLYQQVNNLLLILSGLPAQPLPVDPLPPTRPSFLHKTRATKITRKPTRTIAHKKTTHPAATARKRKPTAPKH